MNRFCPNKITCPGSDSPIANLSAEANDGPNFVSQQPRYSGNGFPEYVAEGCVAPCVSFVSQEDADLCALLQAYLCVNQPDDEPTIDPVVYNDMQVASSECPDGAIFSFFVAAGSFAAANKEMANLIAFTYATEQAHAKRICLSEINGTACEFEEFNQPIVVTGLNRPYTFAVTHGTLPPGVTLETLDDHTARLTGIPSTPGAFTITVQATDPNGNFMQKTYTVSVTGISPDTLPQAPISLPYSQTLTPTGGGAGPFTWCISGGALPPGYTLNPSTGVISGTCDTPGLYTFEVTMAVGTCFPASVTLPYHFLASNGDVIQGTLPATATPNTQCPPGAGYSNTTIVTVNGTQYGVEVIFRPLIGEYLMGLSHIPLGDGGDVKYIPTNPSASPQYTGSYTKQGFIGDPVEWFDAVDVTVSIT